MYSKAEDEASAPDSDFYARRLANYESLKNWYYEQRANTTVKALQNNGFVAVYAENAQKARDEILKLVPEGASVGVGGSMTVRQIGVLPQLAKLGHRLYDHWTPGLSLEEGLAVRRAQLACDVFLSGANALTLDGKIICVDGVGNRVAAMTFGPQKVIIVAGANKITKDLDDALRRVKEVAAPPTLKELGLTLPCTETGSCHDCKSPQRGCSVTMILERKPFFTDTTVVVIGEALGF